MSLRLIHVTRRFGAQLALDDVSIHVRAGDCYGFIGHNGAGKTTAMRIALGLQRADAGQVVVDGFDAARHPREVRARMGGLIEVPGFHGPLDGASNLVLLARLQGLSARDARTEAGRLLELVGLDHAGRKPEHAYSHGMRQRLGIAQAMLGRPAYVLLDEPTNGLDPEGIAEIREVLRRLTRDEGTSVLLSSHQLHEITDVCTRIGVLKEGRVVVEAPKSDLLHDSSGRHVVATDRDAEATRVLAQLGIEADAVGPGGDGGGERGLVFAPGARDTGEIAKALVDAGLGLRRFGPKPTTLEEIYLQSSHGTLAGSPHVDEAEPDPDVAEARRAPGGSVWRVARYELTRWLRRPRTSALLLFPMLLAISAVLRLRAEATAHQALVDSGERFSTTSVTAFEGFGSGLRAGLMLAAWILAGLASQSIAGELSRGTLRNVLLRPVGRVRTALGKAFAVLTLGAITYVALAGASLAVAGWAFDFSDLAEILPNGEPFTLPGFAAVELWPHLWQALSAPLLPLAACCAIGFLAGAIARTGAGALALSLGSLLALDLARTVARGMDREAFLHTAYLPSPLGDTSFLKFYADVAQGVSNTSFAYAETSLVVPLAWCVIAFAIASFSLVRRSVP
jgi:ABC-2 type transport system ATP-binding protein